jgi:hypothetical protein
MTNEDQPTHGRGSWWSERLERSRRRRAERLASMDAELERRMPAYYARRGPRRALAVAGASCLGLLWVDAAVSWILAPSDTAMIANFVILGVLVLAGIPLAGLLIAITRGMTSKREHELDERELVGRLRAFSTAHRCTTVVMAAVMVVTMTADRDGRDSQIPGAALFLILFALLVTHALLPLVVAAWQMPDPPPADDEFGDGNGEYARNEAAS